MNCWHSIVIFLGLLLPCLSVSAETLPYVWGKSYGEDWNQTASSVATDVSGNIIAAGNFNGSIDLGGDLLTSVDGEDIFLAKLDAEGGHVWSQRFGDQGHQILAVIR